MREALKEYKVLLDTVKDSKYYWLLVAELCKQDRFFLLTHILRRPDIIHSWLYDRCREVEIDPDGCLDLWARYHGKSSIITFAGIIQEIIRNPEITICILSYNNATASDFLGQIKRELETNVDLYKAFPNIFWARPKKEAPAWSYEKGLIVKRQSNPKESTIEAFGLVDNQPTGKHFQLRVYDDVIVPKSVTSQEMIDKTTASWELSLNLGTKEINRMWYCGTRYNANDTYGVILNRNILKPRIYPATDDGTFDGTPVFLTQEEWNTIKKSSSDFTVATQQLLNPLAGSLQELKPEWIRRWEVRPRYLNVYILVDPASSKKGSACNTAMAVIGVDVAHNKYLLDGMCHRMDLEQRWNNLKHLRSKWLHAEGIQVVEVGYEKYGMQSDMEHFEVMMRIEGSSFPIQEVSWTRDGTQAKDDRIRRLVPDHKNWQFFYPETQKYTKLMREAEQKGNKKLIAQPIKRKTHDGKVYELTEWFIKNEYLFFPNGQLKDFLDAMSRIYDMNITTPINYDRAILSPEQMSYDVNRVSFYNGMCMEPEYS